LTERWTNAEHLNCVMAMAFVFQTITGRRDYGDGSLFRSKLAQLVDHLHVVWLEAQCFTKLGRRLVPSAKLKQHGS
jgi:hypothetical protein